MAMKWTLYNICRVYLMVWCAGIAIISCSLMFSASIFNSIFFTACCTGAIVLFACFCKPLTISGSFMCDTSCQIKPSKMQKRMFIISFCILLLFALGMFCLIAYSIGESANTYKLSFENTLDVSCYIAFFCASYLCVLDGFVLNRLVTKNTEDIIDGEEES